MVLSELHCYPIKSAGGISLTSALLDARGIAHDRHWMVVDETGKFLTQRTIPRMALLRVALEADHVCVRTEGMNDLRVAFQGHGERMIPVQIWSDSFEAADTGDEAAAWFTRMLGLPCRFVSMPERAARLVNPTYAPEARLVHFGDAFPLLLISQASLDDLNARLPNPVPMNRFRPNLVIDGCGPYEEDTWKRIRIGSTLFRVAKPCARCTVPTIDQNTGMRGQEPIRTLESYRTFEGKVMFGQNLIHEGTGTLTLGDTVTVLG
jgi:uncharacterized protein